MAVQRSEGTLLKIGIVTIGEIVDISGLGGQASKRDRTSLADLIYKRFTLGLIDPGELTMTVRVDFADQGQLQFWAARESKLQKAFSVIFENGVTDTTITFNGYALRCEMNASVDADVMWDFTIAIDGQITGVPAPSP